MKNDLVQSYIQYIIYIIGLLLFLLMFFKQKHFMLEHVELHPNIYPGNEILQSTIFLTYCINVVE